jgi:hypothetical protein
MCGRSPQMKSINSTPILSQNARRALVLVFSLVSRLLATFHAAGCARLLAKSDHGT